MEKKYILVTGAYGGLGKAIVTELISCGYYIFACDLRIDNTFKDEKVIPIKLDVTKKESILESYDIIISYTRELFAIINLAAIFYLDSIVEGTEDKLRKIIETNFFGTYRMNKVFLSLLKQGQSKIINVASELVEYSPQPFMGYYDISKVMIDLYSDVLRRELNYLDIKVVKIHSGSFKTNLLSSASKEYDELILKTKLYKNQLTKLKFMMDKELKKNNNPQKFAKLIIKILKKRKPRICYKIKRSLSLRILSILPEKWQDWIYLKVIK